LKTIQARNIFPLSKGKKYQKYVSINAEPLFTEAPTSIQMVETYNYYSYEYSRKDAQTFLVDYLKKNERFEEARKVNKAPDYEVSSTAGWIARMLSRGSLVHPDAIDYMNKMVDEINMKMEKKEAEVPVIKKKPDVQKNIKDKAYALIDTIEKIFDDGSLFDIYKFLKDKNISEDVASHVYDYFDINYQELCEALVNKEIREAYHFTDDFLAGRVAFYKKFLFDIKTYIIFKSGKVDKIPTVAKVKEGKMTSLSPNDIIGKKKVYNINTKYGYLHCLNALKNESLNINGQRIINVDIDKSWCKYIGLDYIQEFYFMILENKTEDFIKDSIKNKTVYKPISRLNDSTLIVKAA
jgi:hypothetical protein